jgi:hypothetical protein
MPQRETLLIDGFECPSLQETNITSSHIEHQGGSGVTQVVKPNFW